MKKLFGLLFVACGLMTYTACTEDVDEALLNSSEKSEGKVEVTLNLGGEFLTTYTTPLTRAVAKKRIYGVNVYYCHKADSVKLNVYQNYQLYAYGIFTDVTKMKIALSDSYVYKFECTAIQDDRNELYYWTDGLNRDIYGFPFVNMKSYAQGTDGDFAKTATKNKFIYTHEYNLSEITKGKSWIKPIDNGVNQVVPETGAKATDYAGANGNVDIYSVVTYPGTDRFFGVLLNYAVDGTTATINMKRTAFALDIKVDAFNDGTLNIACPNMLDIDISQTGKQFESFYSFDDVYNCWYYSINQYDMSDAKQVKQWIADSTKYLARTLNFTFTRTRSDGTSQSFTRAIDVERNKKTHVIVQAENMSDDPVGIVDNEDVEEGETIIIK